MVFPKLLISLVPQKKKKKNEEEEEESVVTPPLALAGYPISLGRKTVVNQFFIIADLITFCFVFLPYSCGKKQDVRPH